MASSKNAKSAYSDQERKRSTKGKGKDKEKRLLAFENDLIIMTRVRKALKRWKFLQLEISKKQETVNKGGRSNRLEPYKKERDELVEQMKKDIPELQSIFDDECSKAFDRKDIRRTTTGGMIKEKNISENREAHSLRPAEAEINKLTTELENERKSKVEALSSLQTAKAEIIKLTTQLENERKSKDEALSRKSEEYRKELSNLEHRYQEDIKNLEKDKERTKEQDQLQRQAARKEMKEKDIVKEECQRLKRKLDESENENAALKLSHKEEIGAQKEEIRKIEERLEAKNNQLTNQLDNERKAKEDALLKKSEEYRKELSNLEHRYQEDIKNLEKDKERLKKKLDESENENAALKLSHKEEIGALKEEIRKIEERLEAKNNELSKQLDNERKAKEDALLNLEAKKKQLDNERKAKEDALLRLSSMASNKLRDNNPNIADLSDPNRPTKLSEQFSEMYDNEWTDAFDELEKLLGGKGEKEIISYLRDFILEIHSFCSDISSSKLKTIEEAFVKPSVPSEDTKIPTELFKTIKDGIKAMAPKLLEHTRERVLGHLEVKYLNDPVVGCLQHQNVKRYIDKCTEVCWFMSVQDPQLIMDGNKSHDERFDSNKHREYTKKGPYEEFVVWPVLYLYRGGPMMSKGVAQGAKKEIIGQQ